MSSLADRIKIARLFQNQEKAPYRSDINLSVQFLLNCGPGSCKGGSALRAYNFIKEFGYVPYDTCQNYIACSSDSDEGFCPFVDTTCHAMNICRTCSRDENGVGQCTQITKFPNATVAEYGSYALGDLDAVMAEIFARGPIQASINGTAIKNYKGGIITDRIYENIGHNHGVSIVGWGVDEFTGKKHWIVRNSWGEFWGELGMFRVEVGRNLLGIENHLAWATPGMYTTTNFPCDEEGTECRISQAEKYLDPSHDPVSIKRRLKVTQPNSNSESRI